MTTLHIEHPITDLAAWLSAFDAVAPVRRAQGVRAERVRHPVGDATFIVVDLEFDTEAQAATFLEFLRTQIWAVPERSPALAGAPTARILEDVDVRRDASFGA